ncbi:hypothetical protein GJV26_00155 [Massilia dura]|uniref:Uncharacterized protein n=1 Tax=Pseudoduganella dura TaxID=321982 RepID=A0A6I3X270_9BURK|nr:hypothetical protein [Pseudoduganella dura]MUI10909.1 hypothetical protein [Pseudoduganella dura]GGY12846.1 hypothetical protein GCM10007386_49030 [Pseudoduganella dura]
MAWILDAAGYVTSTYFGPGFPANSTNLAPPAGAAQPLQFVNGAWVMATPALTWSAAPAEYWWIDVGSFFDRFGSKSLAITSSTDPEVAGLVMLVLPRKYIDLQRADLPTLLDVLVTKDIITEAEKTAVLTRPTTEQERYIVGLPQPLDDAVGHA